LARRLKSVGAAASATSVPVYSPHREVLPPHAVNGLEQELSVPFAQAGQRQAAAAHAAQQSRQAATASRPSGDPSVRIGPFRPDPSLLPARHVEVDAEHVRANEAGRPSAADRFIPPAAERPEEIQPRMPRVEDFPPVAQRQMRAQKIPAPQHEEERRPRGLLARIASGLSRRDEEEPPVPRVSPTRTNMDVEPRVVAAQIQPQMPPQSGTAAEFIRQAQPRRMGDSAMAAGSLDSRGRSIPADTGREDHLEIPAFLRRQTN
jgi:cell division protein FtsZ